MRFTALLVSAMAALTTAYTKPDYNQPPTGNTITKPGLDDIVTANKPYTIEWKPTTKGPISLVLLRGPSDNVKPLTTLAETIDNSGHFEWIPSTELEPDTTHYGLMLVVEGTGQYQYSTQFGIENPEYDDAPPATTTTAATTDSPATTDAEKPVKYYTYYSTYVVTRTICPLCSVKATATPSATTSFETIPISVSTGAASSSIPSSVAAATSVPAASMTAAATSPSAPAFTGAAGRNTVGLGAVAAGVMAVLAF